MRTASRRLAITALLLLLVGTYAYFLTADFSPPDPYPELAEVHPVLKAAIARELPGGIFQPDLDNGGREKIERALELAGPDGAVPLLAALRDWYSGKPRHTFSHSGPHEDEEGEPIGAWLASRRDPSLNELLLRLAEDDDLVFGMRKTAVIGLCWPGNREVVPRLTRLTFDTGTDRTLREFALVRLPRFETPLLEHIGDHLYLPFADMDILAACVLAATGEPISPSLVRHSFDWLPDIPGTDEYFAAEAVRRMVGDDPELLADCELALSALRDRRIHREGRRAVNLLDPLERVAGGFRDWLDSHPNAFRTPYEEERAAYRASPRHRREEAIATFDDILRAKDDELDFASASMVVCERSANARDRDLDKLDRLARLLERDFVGTEDPGAKLAAMHLRLLPKRMIEFGVSIEEGFPSFLHRVLHTQAGNCVGLTSLYVALGERLDLPLFAVAIPGHVFLRYDDGKTVIDVELTDHGRIRTEADLKGADPRVLTKKELLSVALSNRASAWLTTPHVREETRLERAMGFIDRALLLDDRNESAWMSKANVLVLMDPADPEPALAAAKRAMELTPKDWRPVFTSGEALFTVERYGDALPWYERAEKLDPKAPEPVLGQMVTLQKLDRHREAADRATDWMRDNANDGSIRLVRYRSLVRLRDPLWKTEVEEIGKSWELRIETAEMLLMDLPGSPPDPESALELLDSLTTIESSSLYVYKEGDRTEFQTAEEHFLERVKALREEAKRCLDSRR